MNNNPDSREIEQLARSLAMSGALGDRDRLRVVELLRLLPRLLHHD